MGKILLISIVLLPLYLVSQVAIGKTNLTNSSVALEFGSENRGLILPWVTSLGSIVSPVNGTIVYDLSDHKVKVKYASGWKDLSVDTSGNTIDPVTGIDGAVIQNSASENTLAKVSIGSFVSSASGILILEDTNKAMVLPKVASPHLNIINPAPGMMVYDTVAKQVAVYNGNAWSFWKP